MTHSFRIVRFFMVTKVYVEFLTLFYVFRDGDHEKQRHFDLRPFYDLEIEVKGQIFKELNLSVIKREKT